jgi:hypothetical protein
MASIPEDIFTKYKQFADDFIDENFGVNCTLIYPPRRIMCSNCIFDSVGQKSSNRYKHGGPAPFSFGYCAICGGEGYKEEERTDTIKMRVYFSVSEDTKVVDGVTTPNVDAQVIGFIYDLPKFNRANEIICNSDLENYSTWKFTRIREAVPHGLRKDRYFMAYLKRI